MRLLLIADTHVPRRARDLPVRLWEEVALADVVVHAGDWVVPELLDELTDKAARVVACWGNNDGPVLRSRLPEHADVVLDGLHLTVVHETGGTAGRESRMSRRYPDTDVPSEAQATEAVAMAGEVVACVRKAMAPDTDRLF